MKKLLSVGCALASLSLAAETFVLKQAPSSLADWKDGAFYEGGVAPTGVADDVISVPDSVPEIIVAGSDSDTIAFLGTISRVLCKESVFAIDVSTGEIDFNCAVYADGSHKGTLEKRGAGTLNLKSYRKIRVSDSAYDYQIDVHVRAGVLRLPKAAANSYNMYELVTVDEGATLVTPDQASWQIRGLAGGGLVTNESATTCNILDTTYYGNGPTVPTFSGTLGGKLAFQVREGARQRLSGTNSTIAGGVSMGYKNAELYVAKFGADKNDPSSVGKDTYSVQMTGSNTRAVYEGRGETTYKDIYAYGGYPTILDGGACGGLILAGDFPLWSTIKTSTVQRGLVLDGSNATECVIAGRFDPKDYTVSDSPTQWHIAKRGTGTWRFTADDHKNLCGLFAVENGTLAFDSIKQRGVACALGTATRTYADGTEISAATKVGYAYLLGTTNSSESVGFLQYRGAAAAECVTRPFALAGTGGFKSYEGAGRIAYSDVTSAGSDPVTLVLAGDAAVTNFVSTVTNGEGVVSVRKEGAGTWTLCGDLNFTGSLEAKGGTLLIRQPNAGDEYRWYRLVIKEIAHNNAAMTANHSNWAEGWGYICCNEIALYDENGIRQNLDLKGSSNYADLQPGEAAFSTDRPLSKNGAGHIIENYFDDLSQATNGAWNGVVMCYTGYGADASAPQRSDPFSWFSVDMRLPATANRIVQYDLCTGTALTSTSGGRAPSAFALYGSTDGVVWDLLRDEFDEVDEGLSSANNYQWMGANKVLDAGKERGGRTHAGGWMLKKTAPVARKMLPEVGPVTVANGATLKYEGDADGAPALSQVKLAAGATGSIDGFAFAEDGTFEIDAMAKGSVSVGVTLPNATGLANVANWQVRVGGALKPNYRVKATADGFTVTKSGLTVIIR